MDHLGTENAILVIFAPLFTYDPIPSFSHGAIPLHSPTSGVRWHGPEGVGSVEAVSNRSNVLQIGVTNIIVMTNFRSRSGLEGAKCCFGLQPPKNVVVRSLDTW